MRVAVICLGRFGDCCGALQIALHKFQQGNHVTFIIAREFASLLGGVTYVEPQIYDGNYSECLKAAEQAEQSEKFDKVMVCQVYGTSIDRQTDSFVKEAWRAVGKLHLWGKLPLVFDNRSVDRERHLIADVLSEARCFEIGITPQMPIVLVAYSGRSSPFPHISQLVELLKTVSSQFHFVDISDLKCERFYDLLGLMERATCLIATDSGPLHLANAVPKLPVIALITDRPDMWHGSPAQPNHILRIRYSDFEKSKGKIIDTLNGILTGKQTPRDTILFHVWNDYERQDDGNLHRHRLAKNTWEKTYNAHPMWMSYPVHDNMLTRSSLNVGEKRRTPFVKDVINMVANEARADDILVFTNDDNLMLEGFTATILEKVIQHRAIWGSRWELPMGVEPKWGSPKGYKHVGADVFAFTKQWWDENQDSFPDHLISFEAWDLNLRILIESTGGTQVEGLVAHYIHQPVWHSREHREGIGNLHNRKLFQQWLAQRNLKWPSV